MQRSAFVRLIASLVLILLAGDASSQPMTNPFGASPPLFLEIIAVIFAALFVIVIVVAKWRELTVLSFFAAVWYVVYSNSHLNFWVSLGLVWVGLAVPLFVADRHLAKRRRRSDND